jgi:DNA-directed RNA polymerase subunit omega
MKPVDGFDSKYRYVLVAARRARQLQNGAQPVVEPHSHKACRIAEEEINAGKVKWTIPPASNATDEAVSEPPTSGVVGGEADD